jgi:hypothetical protein
MFFHAGEPQSTREDVDRIFRNWQSRRRRLSRIGWQRIGGHRPPQFGFSPKDMLHIIQATATLRGVTKTVCAASVRVNQ